MLFQPDVLEACLPGAQRIEAGADDTFEARIERAVASIRLETDLRVEVVRDDRPEGVTLDVEGVDERTSSTIDGTVRIDVEEDEGESVLSYEADVAFTGRLASLGPRLVQRQLTSDLRAFFAALADHVGATTPTHDSEETAES